MIRGLIYTPDNVKVFHGSVNQLYHVLAQNREKYPGEDTYIRTVAENDGLIGRVAHGRRAIAWYLDRDGYGHLGLSGDQILIGETWDLA